MGIFSFIPLPYKIFAAILMIAGLFVGGYYYGYRNGNAQSTIAIANFKQKQTALSGDLSAIDLHVVTKIVTRYVTKYVHIKDVGVQNEKVIIDYVPDHGFLSDGWVSSYNSTITTGESIDPTVAANDTPSGITAAQALAEISKNNSTCLIYKEQVIGLQDWIIAHNAAIVKANKDAKKN